MKNSGLEIEEIFNKMQDLTSEGKNRLQNFINFSGEKILCADNDSTIMDGEIVDVLAQIVGGNSAKEIASITNACMDGKVNMSFEESLKKRIKILVKNGLVKTHLQKCIESLNFSHGFESLVEKMLETYGTLENKVFILSGGFEEVIKPKIFELNLPETEKQILSNQVFANAFLFENDKVVGVDFHSEEKNMWREFAKLIKIQKLRELGLISNSAKILALGDGSNDVSMIINESEGLFVSYSGVVTRKNTIEKSCGIECKDFFEVGRILLG